MKKLCLDSLRLRGKCAIIGVYKWAYLQGIYIIPFWYEKPCDPLINTLEDCFCSKGGNASKVVLFLPRQDPLQISRAGAAKRHMRATQPLLQMLHRGLIRPRGVGIRNPSARPWSHNRFKFIAIVTLLTRDVFMQARA